MGHKGAPYRRLTGGLYPPKVKAWIAIINGKKKKKMALARRRTFMEVCWAITNHMTGCSKSEWKKLGRK